MKKWCSRWAANKKLPRASLPTPRLSRPNPPKPNRRPPRQRISVEEQYEKGYLKFQVAFPSRPRIVRGYWMNKNAKALARLTALPVLSAARRLALFFCSSTKRIFKRFGFKPPWARGLGNPTAAAPAWFGYACARPNRCNIKCRIREPGRRISGSLQPGWPHGRSPFGQFIVN